MRVTHSNRLGAREETTLLGVGNGEQSGRQPKWRVRSTHTSQPAVQGNRSRP